MPFELSVPASLAQAWRVKIRENERLEPPHVSLIRGSSTWRFGLRTAGFLDGEPPARNVPKVLVRQVMKNLTVLREAWDRMYPENPVGELR